MINFIKENQIQNCRESAKPPKQFRWYTIFLVLDKIKTCYLKLLQILKLHMVLLKLEMLQANNKLFYAEKIHTNL
jgi:hypothetical protein